MPLNGLQNGTSKDLALEEHPTAPSIYESSSLASIRASLSALHTRDAAITSRLQTLISSQADLSRELGRLDLLRAHLGTQVIHTRDISNGMLDSAAGTASHLSSKVKELDLEKKRVEETLGVVEQVAELKACVQGVVGSMGAPQDWEAAAGYIARASKIPKHIVEGNFAARIVPNVEVPDAPGITIENAKESLCGLFLREFEKAAEEGDGTKVTRFFKLFPLIGREETGLEVYGRYVCQGVGSRARTSLREGTGGSAGKDGFFYANALTRLFEHIAQIVEGHGGLVERHYGQGKMVKVIERLQVEADVQGGIILDMWSDERHVDRRLMDVKSYPFSFLVQSFTAAPSSRGVMRTSSPAVGGGTNGRVSEDEGVDMKEIDTLLSETAVMLGRWSLYSRFVGGKCREQDASDEELLVMPELLVKSALGRKISTRITTPFNEMTTFFLRRSVEKAFQLDETPQDLTLDARKPLGGNPPFIISAVDDVMYIVNTVLQRSLSTSSRDVVASVIPTTGRVLGSEFIGMIQRKMRDESYPKPVVQGGLPPEDKIIAFLVLINSLDLANDYVSRIVNSRITPPEPPHGGKAPNTLSEMFPFDHDATFVTHALQNLKISFSSKTSELLADGLHVMFDRVVKLRLRPIIVETFRDVDYSLTEEDVAEIARNNDTDDDLETLNDLVTRRFEHSWDALMKPIQRIMTAKTFSSLLDQTAKYLARTFEKRVWAFGGKMNALGAQRMERDFSGIIGVVARGGRYGVRDAFARVAQICMLVNMEDEELEALNEAEAEGEEEMAWVLSEDERRRARALVRN
ncbi:related to conserved oligomeric golgi complex component 4 [Phialocephala subalpina]|uniref:Conserved oligomeric Golgi complex subunit 4 n=1 Tax=Phialocephala subalpina TaxID=576137 RepID=A0A1L7WCG0_9HELO|nr:related to conserved oligomeric golgi complex component 4 [Phialocephala subalpina]